jgi:hypothetical protein
LAGLRLLIMMEESNVERAYGMSLEEIQEISDRMEPLFEDVEERFGSQPMVIGMAMIGLIVKRTGREGLEQLLYGARHIRQQLMDEEKADARAAKQARRQRQ